MTTRLLRKPGVADYSIALGSIALGLAFVSVPVFMVQYHGGSGLAFVIVFFAALVITAIYLGTAPAAVAAAAGGVCATVLTPDRPLLTWPPFNTAQVDALLIAASCAAVLCAVGSLRRVAALAAADEARLLEVFRQIPGAAAILEAPHGRLLLRSSQSAAVLGHPEGRVQQSDDIGAYGGVHEDGRQYAPADYPIVRALKAGEIVRAEKLKYRHPDGRVVDLEVHAGPVRNPDGTIIAAVGMAFDVSERIAAERRLKASEARHRTVAERLHAAIDAGSLGLWELELATQRIRLDAKFAGMLGMPHAPVELPREDLHNLVQPNDRLRAAAMLDGAIADGSDYSDEVHMRTIDGQERWFVTRGAVQPELGQVVGVVSDVTERRQREDALRAALNARDVLMYEADHRIKNSLQMVVSLLGLQARRVADAEARQALDAAIGRVETIANAHLALQRSPDLRSIEIDQMLADLCGRLGSLNPAITMRCETQSGLSMDADRAIPLGLLASEIMTNAMRHAYPFGVPGEVRLTAAAEAGILAMTIADSGTGMPATPTRRGLGSTLIAALASQIGATLDTISRPGAGTTINLRMPAQVCTRKGPAADSGQGDLGR